MATVHANNPRDAIARLETLVLMAGMDLPPNGLVENWVRQVQFTSLFSNPDCRMVVVELRTSLKLVCKVKY